ncbi:hypothetical protein AURDEDRAFT_172560 [Auricularia subglabra TFB-10046 SS5]|nr:hypothetical protein AURDEDRAFT_172560 [Auricularia subglabra TFB-10046 SS5]
MSHVRESVEWAFGEITQHWAFLSFAENQKVLLQPVGVYYLAAALLTNALNIFHTGKTSKYFDCAPPSLEEYFNGTPSGPMDAAIREMSETAPYGDVEVQMDDIDWQSYSNAEEDDM